MTCCIHRSPPRRPPPITIDAVLAGLVASIGEMVAGPSRLVAEAELESIAIRIRALATKINAPRKATRQ
jgi:hypothetical protein